ncbi:hypothetical protein K3495_g2532 [Podosphaera aphanis]|nr:hypothetical protein K3495_g2532 [Podosphaera aphanis]
MKYESMVLGFSILSSANIILTHAPLSCKPDESSRVNNGCLRHQECTPEGKCVVIKNLENNLSFRNKNPTAARSVAFEGMRCGKDFGNTTCGNNRACCSNLGYCRSSTDHCLVQNGCQSGCASERYARLPKRWKSPLSRFFNYLLGPKYFSSAEEEEQSEPVLKIPIEPVIGTSAGISQAGLQTQDGTCGVKNNNTVCKGSTYGNCCSLYGFCGNSSAHCGDGCQSGECFKSSIPAPGPKPAPVASNGGIFQNIGQAGVAVMHAGLLPNGKVFFLDKLENYSQIRTSDGQYAMSAEYDPITRRPIALSYSTNAFCSGGTYLADGRVISVGGNGPLEFINPKIGDGFKGIRTLARSIFNSRLDGQAWEEPKNRKLSTARWYPTAQIMPDGSVFVASGSLNGLDPAKPQNNNPTYEILDRDGSPRGRSIKLDILERNQPYYMYPFVHVLPDGNLFIFVSKQAQVFNVRRNTVIKEISDLPGDYRTYPNTGGSILLPLSSANNWKAEVIICGGGVYQDIDSPTDASCGRIAPLDRKPAWEMESMPEGRGMVEGTLLPDGTSIWLNGGSKGAQGFGLMSRPALEALHYDPKKPVGQRFSIFASSTIPRLYHSCALLLLDGTILVVGSNPVEMPKLRPDVHDAYVTEYRVEQFTPPYLQGKNARRRPTNLALKIKKIQANNSTFQITFSVPAGAKNVKVALYHGGFVTHSLHMGHRMLFLDNTGFRKNKRRQKLVVHGPPNKNLAPPGPYVIYVVVDGIPSMGKSVMIV